LRVNAVFFIGMRVIAIAGMIVGLVPVPTQIVVSIPSLSPTFGQALIHSPDIFSIQMLVVILTFLCVGFFDTAGTLVA
ncbi:NCS2 family permease, partial [Bacillus pumilus]